MQAASTAVAKPVSTVVRRSSASFPFAQRASWIPIPPEPASSESTTVSVSVPDGSSAFTQGPAQPLIRTRRRVAVPNASSPARSCAQTSWSSIVVLFGNTMGCAWCRSSSPVMRTFGKFAIDSDLPSSTTPEGARMSTSAEMR